MLNFLQNVDFSKMLNTKFNNPETQQNFSKHGVSIGTGISSFMNAGIPANQPNAFGDIGGGALSGAATGAGVAGPLGAAIGGGLGLIGGIFKNKKKKKELKRQEQEFQKQREMQFLQNSMASTATYNNQGIGGISSFAKGGLLKPNVNIMSGNAKPLSNNSIEFKGKKHKDGGVLLDSDKDFIPDAEVEGGETMTNDGQIFSDRLSVSPSLQSKLNSEFKGKKFTGTFADVHAKLEKMKSKFESKDDTPLSSATLGIMKGRIDEAINELFADQDMQTNQPFPSKGSKVPEFSKGGKIPKYPYGNNSKPNPPKPRLNVFDYNNRLNVDSINKNNYTFDNISDNTYDPTYDNNSYITMVTSRKLAKGNNRPKVTPTPEITSDFKRNSEYTVSGNKPKVPKTVKLSKNVKMLLPETLDKVPIPSKVTNNVSEVNKSKFQVPNIDVGTFANALNYAANRKDLSGIQTDFKPLTQKRIAPNYTNVLPAMQSANRQTSRVGINALNSSGVQDQGGNISRLLSQEIKGNNAAAISEGARKDEIFNKNTQLNANIDARNVGILNAAMEGNIQARNDLIKQGTQARNAFIQGVLGNKMNKEIMKLDGAKALLMAASENNTGVVQRLLQKYPHLVEILQLGDMENFQEN